MITDSNNGSLVCHVDTVYYCEECNKDNKGGWYYQRIRMDNDGQFCVTSNDSEQSTINLYLNSQINLPLLPLCCIVPDIYGIEQTHCVNTCKYNQTCTVTNEMILFFLS